jgi:L-ascorbate metabolism protein UlaG (beta-lactamase superfamily)
MSQGPVMAEITSLGNAGFLIRHSGQTILIDPYFRIWERLTGLGPSVLTHLDLILITHDHFDHFASRPVAHLAGRTGAAVAGPSRAIEGLRPLMPSAQLRALPLERPGQAVEFTAAQATITAFRTVHGEEHLSYLAAWPAFRWFHDGDNEETRVLEAGGLRPLDILLLCPWKGAGWSGFVSACQPRFWMLHHLDEDEIAQHQAGHFLDGLDEKPPSRPHALALRPGQSMALPSAVS